MESIIFRKKVRKGGSCGCTGSSKTALQKGNYFLGSLQSKATKKVGDLSHQLYTMLGGTRRRKHKRTRRSCRSKRRSRK
jgi:hypothetical protein